MDEETKKQEQPKKVDRKVVYMLVGFFVVIVVLVGILVSIVLILGGSKYKDFETYEADNYTIKYHKDWYKETSPIATMFTPTDFENSEDEPDVTVAIFANKLTPDAQEKSRDELMNELTEEFESNLIGEGAEVFDTTSIEIDSVEWNKKIYEVKESDIEGKAQIYWTIADDMQVLMMYVAVDDKYDDTVDTAEKTIESFEFVTNEE